MDLDIAHIQSVCRTCLTRSRHMKNIFNIADIIMSFAPIQLEQDDGLPSKICPNCTVLAKKAHEFRLLCLKSDVILRQKLRENNVTIKVEKCDSDSAEVHTDSDYSAFDNTDDTLSKINIINEVHKSESHDIHENETFEFCKTEVLEIDNEIIPAHNNETLTIDHASYTTKIGHCQDNAIYPQSTNEKKNKVVSDANVGSNSKLEYTCQYCDKKFLYRSSFVIHVQKHKDGLKCHICEKGFQTLRQFQTHINMHKRKGVHVCPTCGKKYTFPENLVVHQRIHTGTKPYSCRFCDKSFTQWNERRSHEVVHTSERPYLCSVCGSNFSRSHALLNHTRRVHFDPSEDRPHVCTVCDKKFKVRYDLTKHILSHTDERNYECQVCNKAFKNTKCLRQHEKIHSGDKVHVCPVCQRAFLQKHVLITHLNTH